MRRNHLLAAAAGVLALVIAAGAFASPMLTQEAKLKSTATKGKRSTGVSGSMSVADPGAQPAGNVPALKQIVLALSKGTKVDLGASEQCNLSDAEIRQGRCSASSVVGNGSAKVNVTSTTGGATVVVARGVAVDVTAYAQQGGAAILLNPSDGGADSVVVHATVTRTGKLSADVPTIRPFGQNSKAAVTDFALKIKAKTKGKGRKQRRLVTTPRCPKSKQWKHRSTFTYEDGSQRTVRTVQKCKRPKPRRR
jgi:hypothetical protein